MNNNFWFISLLVLFLSACGAGEKPSEVLDITEAQADAVVPLPDPKVNKELLDNAGVDVEEIPDKREVAPEEPVMETPATATIQRPVWMKESPFFEKGGCAGWDGEAKTITAECCKYVVANYAGVLDNPEKYDLLKVMTQDPYVSSCRRFNTEFQDAFDQIENPE